MYASQLTSEKVPTAQNQLKNVQNKPFSNYWWASRGWQVNSDGETQAGEKPLLCERLAISDPLAYKNIVAQKLPTIAEPLAERYILHYDLYAQYRKDGFARVVELINWAEQVTVLTLCASGKLLRRRNLLRVIQNVCTFQNYLQPRRQIKRLRKYAGPHRRFFCDTVRLEQLYDDWFTLIADCGIKHHLLLDADDYGSETIYPYSRKWVEALLDR